MGDVMAESYDQDQDIDRHLQAAIRELRAAKSRASHDMQRGILEATIHMLRAERDKIAGRWS